MGMPSPASDDELLLGCHLVYEIDMLRETYQRCPKEETTITDDIIKNALIESFCVHARNLIELFEGKDAKYNKKYSDSNYQPFSTVHEDIIRNIENRLNGQISHLVYRGRDGRTIETSEKINDKDRAEIFNILSHCCPVNKRTNPIG
jgi:hypothetical protein